MRRGSETAQIVKMSLLGLGQYTRHGPDTIRYRRFLDRTHFIDDLIQSDFASSCSLGNI